MKPLKKTLYVDADVSLYRSCVLSEVETDWGNDLWTLHSDLGQAKEIFSQEIAKLGDFFPDGPIVLCFTGKTNFRKDIMPTYKANRKKVRKPLLMGPLMDWAMGLWQSEKVEGLEADDLLGLLGQDNVMVSVDKDLRTVPGLHFNPDKPEEGVVTVSQELADYNHLFQTLCGDSTDGYKGCPGVGVVGAAKLLVGDDQAMWAAVVGAFEKKKIPYADMMAEARVARILRGAEYDFGLELYNLWSPPA